MRIANQHALILVAGFVVAIVATGMAGGFAAPYVAIVFVALSACNIFVVRPRAWRWLWRRAGVRLQRAYAREDFDGAVALAEDLAAQSPTVGAREAFVANRGVALIAAERWQTGIAVLRGLDRRLLSPTLRILVDNALAWGVAHDGALEEAIALARATADAARADAAFDPLSRAACIGTLGVALVRAHMPEAGLVYLREALAIGGPARTQASRLLYIGDAEQALGRDAEARAAWADAAARAPQSRWGVRAAERLKSASPVPYR